MENLQKGGNRKNTSRLTAVYQLIDLKFNGESNDNHIKVYWGDLIFNRERPGGLARFKG